MSRRPVVSVIMPAFNTAPYIATAIQSAQTQTLRDIEVLVVDDGSTDKTFATALGCAAGDRRVRVVTQNNGGPSAARNRAMKMARGELFACLDSDDEWMPTYLEEQLAAFDRHPAASVVTANAVNRGGALNGTPYRPIEPVDRAITFLDIVRQEDAICIMTVFRRAVYDVIGPFDETLSGNEDYEFWLRAALHGFEFVQTFQPLAYYRRRPDSASANDLKMTAGILRVFAMVRRDCRSVEELAAVDAQMERYTRELLAIQARIALRRHDFESAAESYARLHERSGDVRAHALMLAARRTPRLLLLLADIRRAIRGRRARAARA
jgi:glycosyltransferase involved in cell wall biosynthesis